jgi:hypothetical protein
MNISLLPIFILATVIAAQAQQQSEIVQYYQQWIGCKAPPIRFDRSDRSDNAEKTYAGKKLLLYGLNSGNFVNNPDKNKLKAELRNLDKVRKEAPGAFCVICFTRGLVLAGTLAPPLDDDLKQITQFPWINLNNKHGENTLGEPLEMLHEPGGILVDTNGIICRIYQNAMTEADFRDVIQASSWTGPINEPPKLTSRQKWDDTPKSLVLVAFSNISAGTSLSTFRRFLAKDYVPNDRLPTNAILAADMLKALGGILRVDVAARQPITWDMVDTNTVQTNIVPTKRSTTTPVQLRSTGDGER